MESATKNVSVAYGPRLARVEDRERAQRASSAAAISAGAPADGAQPRSGTTSGTCAVPSRSDGSRTVTVGSPSWMPAPAEHEEERRAVLATLADALEHLGRGSRPWTSA